MRDHGAELYRFARRVLGDNGLAEEAVQETFVKAWRRAHRFDPERASLRTWLFAILRNTTVDMARARATRPALTLDDRSTTRPPIRSTPSRAGCVPGRSRRPSAS